MTGSVVLDMGMVVVALGCAARWLHRRIRRVKRAVLKYDEEAKRLTLVTELKDDNK